MAEVIVDEGIEINEALVNEFHDFLLQKLAAPFSLLINRKNSYSYTFKAQMAIGKLDEIKAMAVVADTSGGYMSTETLININKRFKIVNSVGGRCVLFSAGVCILRKSYLFYRFLLILC
mgnify:CR=1 FL=1